MAALDRIRRFIPHQLVIESALVKSELFKFYCCVQSIRVNVTCNLAIMQ